MCRFLAYLGHDIVLDDLLYEPEYSLVHQSYHAHLRSEPLNGDGFGVGWYEPAYDWEPVVFRSIRPAWNEQNLRSIARKTESGCIFAHVRAASPGMVVSEINCHPFQAGRYLWMHNGGIPEFDRIKRTLRSGLSDRSYGLIQGTTDSEHAFALFLDLLNPSDLLAPAEPDALVDAMRQTIGRLDQLTVSVGIHDPGWYNFAVTDGQSIVVTRYGSNSALTPASLFSAQGSSFICEQRQCRMIQDGTAARAILIVSEPLTAAADQWLEVQPNHLLLVRPDLSMSALQIIG